MTRTKSIVGIATGEREDREPTPGEQAKTLFGPQEFGLVMISVGLVALLLAALENCSAIKALAAQYPAKEGYPEIRRSRALMLAALIAVLGLLALFSMLVRR